MKLTHVRAENFLGIEQAHAKLEKIVHFFGGLNASGKSSLVEAVRLALTGDSLRVPHKKDYAALLHNPAEPRGLIEVGFANGAEPDFYRVHIPEGKRIVPLDSSDEQEARVRCVIDAQHFARLDEKAKRRLLFDVMGVSFDRETISKKLEERGVGAEHIASVMPLLRQGFDAACAESATMAREKKAAWKAVTGEQWGSEKAPGWRATVPQFDARAFDDARAALTKAQTALDEENRRLGAIRQAQQVYDAAKVERAGLEKKPVDLERSKKSAEEAREAFETAKRAHSTLSGELAAAKEGVNADDALACPCCKAKLLLLEGALVDASKMKARAGKKQITALELKVQGAASAMKKAADAVLEADNALADAVKRSERLKVLDETLSQGVPVALEATKRVSDAEGARNDRQAALAKLEDERRAFEDAKGRTDKAAKLHAEIEAWLALADALAPTGIPGELLAKAFEPLNKRLDDSAAWAEWPRVEIHPDMLITLGGRSYPLLSESEKWRADAMIADALAYFSGLKLLVLDRADVLIARERERLIGWLYNIAEDYDTILVFASLKDRPDLPPEFGSHWIENGRLQ